MKNLLNLQDQLDAFEAERRALMSVSTTAQSEVEKLSRDYAKLLGHQNQKQKIQHILKIKEENNSLKMVGFDGLLTIKEILVFETLMPACMCNTPDNYSDNLDG